MDTLNWIKGAAQTVSYRLRMAMAAPEALSITAGAPIYLLGETYRGTGEEPDAEALAQLICDLRSRIWLTYRQGFAPIEGSSLTSDAGWGCMLRTGQMMLAQALIVLRAGRGWRTADGATQAVAVEGDESHPAGGTAETESEGEGAAASERRLRDELGVVSLFADVAAAPFSIQRIAAAGAGQGTPVGKWFGPTPISQVLALLLARTLEAAPAASEAPEAPGASEASAPAASGSGAGADLGLSIHVAMDGSLYRQQVQAVAGQPDGSWRPVLVLLPLRLGLDTLNPSYGPCLCALFALRQTVGIIGGAPRRSFYFVGCQGEQLLYLDPHEVQPALGLPLGAEQLRSCHCLNLPRSISVSQIDPSLALGFLCSSSQAFDELCASCAEIFRRTLPAFSIGDAPPYYLAAGDAETSGNEEDEDEDLVVV